MNRRDFVLGLGALAATGSAFANNEGRGPFDTVGPHKADARTVYEFLSFSCPYCQQYHEAIAAWGRSIPVPVKFEPVPVVVDLETFKAARAFYSVLKAAPSQIDIYTRVALEGYRRGYTDIAAPEILHQGGVNRKAFDQAWKSPMVKTSIETAMALTEKYAIAVTPSIAIGGTTVLHADHVNGDYGMLMKLASGFVSRLLER